MRSGNRYAMCSSSLVCNQLDYGIAFPIIFRVTIQSIVLFLEPIITFERNLFLPG